MKPERWREIERLCHEALALPVQQRTAFLSEACGNDEGLLNDVESLLVQEARISGFMSEPAIPDLLTGGALSGRRLHAYVLNSLEGEGGMGEVYSATDTRLNRIVAIKVLPPFLRDQPERNQRFKREAETLAAVNHPHICPIYDVGEQDGINFLVMEYLQGETLADRLRKGRIPFDQVLRYASEIADALAAAHQRGIIHRDLKPGNIMLTKSGAMLLDFGLAKLQCAESGEDIGISNLARLTTAGDVLGTPNYMAPEQIEGKQADARSDIFSFGAVVYEMATGMPAFVDCIVPDVATAKVAHEGQRISTSETLHPPAFGRVIKACLANDPDERWQSAADLARELQWIGDSAPYESALRSSETVRYRVAVRWLALVPIAIVALLGLRFFATFRQREPGGLDETRLLINTPPRMSNPFNISISPDGRLVVFLAQGSDGTDRLFARPIASESATELQGTEGALNPFWSPDSRYIGFGVQSSLKLMRVEASGGLPQIVCNLRFSFTGGSWNSDGVIIFSDNGRLFRVSAAGGTPTTAGSRPAQENWRWPYFLPDGHQYLFVSDTSGALSVYVASLDSDERKRVMPSDSMAAYAPPGVLLFVRQGTLFSQPFDVSRMELSGDPVPLAQGVLTSYIGRAAFAVSNRAALIYRTGRKGRWRWLNRAGGVTPIRTPIEALTLRLAPDGKRAAFFYAGANTTEDIWIYDDDRDQITRLTDDPANDHWPVWSPDGSRVAFDSTRLGGHVLYEKPANGAIPERQMLQPESGFGYGLHDWSLDDRYILFQKKKLDSTSPRAELWVMPRFGDRKPFPYPTTSFFGHAALSPNARWIAYTSNETGRPQILVQSFPDPSRARAQVSHTGGILPRWSRDGRELFYVDDGRIFAVPVRTTSTFEFGPSTDVFGAVVLGQGPPGYLTGPAYPYDVTPDGQRFLVSSFPLPDPGAPITVVTNWTARLKH
jgi:eukaryotic-like serine/threonine-protein kinase